MPQPSACVALKILEMLRCRADLAVNGRDAVDAHIHEPYDLIFMDCCMPEMDGFEASAFLACLRACQNRRQRVCT